MSILYKLVGVSQSSDNPNVSFYHSNFKNDKITYSDVITYFESIGLPNEKLQFVKFITQEETMNSNQEKEYLLSTDSDNYIFVFTMKEELKSMLRDIFNKNLNSDKLITQEIIKKSNEEAIKLLNDEDFKLLLRIYRTKPQYFQELSKFLSSGDIVIDNFNDTIIENNYDTEFKEIKDLNLNISDEDIIKKLKINRGHINLTLRSLLYDC